MSVVSNVEKDFIAVMGFRPLHLTNKPEDLCVRKDNIFALLSEKAFDNPRLLCLLEKKLKYWLALEKSELIYAVAGYVYYIKEDFQKAGIYFLKAVNKNRENLDNWFDLAFSLYHQRDRKHNLGKMILFNFDYCVKGFRNKNVNLKAIEKGLRKQCLFSGK